LPVDADTLLSFITNLGDAGLLLPASAAVILALWLGGDRRTAAVLASCLALTVGLTVAAKLAFMTCAATDGEIHSPSGHASLATTFFLALAMIGVRMRNRFAGGLFAVACAAAVLLIAASRVALGMHTLAETLAGIVIGLAPLGLFWRYAAQETKGIAPLILVLLIPLGVAYAASGAHIGVEPFLERLSDWLAARLAC
jgi:membrane-associated phospholipid phosphatase